MSLTAAEVNAIRRQKWWSWLLTPLIYVLVVLTARLYFHYSLKEIGRFREKIWKQLDGHDGPVIWAANHLTLIDSFLVFWAIFPWYKVRRTQLVPWSTPEYRNYYHLGNYWQQRLIRGVLYLCRCIPFLRGGEDAASLLWREKAFEKCAWILKDGGSVFVYPEAGRSRKGWLEPHQPKDFLGRLALEVPQAKFLCVYMRGEGQLYTTTYPAQGETFRAYGTLLPGPQENEPPRAVSQRLFDTLAQLQEDWFKGSSLTKNCGGNDVLDLKSPLLQEHFDLEHGEADPDWLDRHLTAKEKSYLNKAGKEALFVTCCKFIAAKEAAHKALTQSGIHTPRGAFHMLEADLFRRKVEHLPSGCQVDIAFTTEDQDKLHCIAVLRGGYIGDSDANSDVLWGVDELPPGANPSEFVRERCLALIAQSADDIPSADGLAFTEENGIPKILHRGKTRDWGVSLSHSGRFVAYSFMIS